MYETYLSSGKNVTEWCAKNGISKKTFYYRLRQLRKDVIETAERHEIVPITAVTEQKNITTDSSIKIQGSGISIELPTELPKLGDVPSIDQLDKLLPWSDELAEFCK